MTTERDKAVEAVRSTLAELGAASPHADTDTLAERVVTALEAVEGPVNDLAEASEIVEPEGDEESDKARAEGHDVADGDPPASNTGQE